jgi:hypothetical protein
MNTTLTTLPVPSPLSDHLSPLDDLKAFVFFRHFQCLILALSALLALSLIANAGSVVLPVYGCHTMEDFKRISPYVRTVDVEPVGHKRRDAMVKAGRCRKFGAGEKALIEKTEKFLRCIIPKGATDCYWVRNIDVVDAGPP